MEAKAVSKYVWTTPRKVRLVVRAIRGLSVTEALETLPYMKKRAAKLVEKTIRTAVANAKQKGMAGELKFKEVQVGEGPRRVKKYLSGGRGRVRVHKRRLSHIRVVLESAEEKKVERKKVVKRAAKPKKVVKTEKKSKSTKGKK